MRGAPAARRLLADDWGVAADVWSATSWNEFRRDAPACDDALLRGEERTPYVTRALAGVPGPVPAVSDWMRAVPDRIARWIPQDWNSIGTDGFGLSGTREDVRRHFGVGPGSVAVAGARRRYGR
ncbi:pyruvate dehydrogenase E1 component [Kitasatospora sp. SolWspMP-SS2h]|nr:pyruvate dehydrogenase E1 component [Kitasatospora sp. SolWspMP-SS2h]